MENKEQVTSCKKRMKSQKGGMKENNKMEHETETESERTQRMEEQSIIIV
jgi:hypothetical protein